LHCGGQAHGAAMRCHGNGEGNRTQQHQSRCDEECAAELSPLTRWVIGGRGTSGGDKNIPPEPVFGLYSNGQGTVEVMGIAFREWENTRGITAGTKDGGSTLSLTLEAAPEKDGAGRTVVGGMVGKSEARALSF